MLNQDYTIALVFSPKGLLSTAQFRVVRARVKQTLTFLGSSGVNINVVVPLLNGMPADDLPKTIFDLQYLSRTSIEFMRVNRAGEHCRPDGLIDRLKHCDEVWICPPTIHSYFSRSTTSSLYHASQKSEHAKLFKLIPRDVDPSLEPHLEPMTKKEKEECNN